MRSKAERLLVVESDDRLRDQIVVVLSDAGYEVSTDYEQGIKAVLAFDPDAVVMGADPPRLDCCDLLSELKGSERTQNIRVVMLSPGGSAERTRGLELGADDVVSLPFDSHELLSRVRSQLRDKSVADGFREKLRLAEESQNTAQQVVTAVNEERRTLRVGGLATVGVLIVASLVLLIFYRRTQEQNTRVYAAITRLQTGVLAQQQLRERSRPALEDRGHSPSQVSDPQKLQLQQKSEDLRSQIAASKTEDASTLQRQLAVVDSRLQKLETEGRVAQTIIQSYEPSVCLIHVVLAFRDHTTGLRLHYAEMTSSGEPKTDEHNNPLLSLTGSGPEVHLDVFGTGFLASPDGQILTNHHVAEPWWQNDDLKEMVDQGIEPVVVEMSAYFPGVPHGIAINTEKISSAADVAVVKGNVSELGIKQIALADSRRSAVSGGPVVLLGYPTALDAILARAGADTLQSIATASKGDPKQVMEELARRKLIRPVTTQGHIGDVLPDKIVYDAQTTSGGSGGPLFNNEGKVIGINFAMVREFGGSNFAIPVGYGKSLLKP
ncbi:MAG TPA: trypsin-like peptidase domain-containing protein [Candidatus Sulfotelmatobacter sp.]|nr:trypsin-like peptidase domain-containing protein [Candidatus Sulfotelmatobacter sp.]